MSAEPEGSIEALLAALDSPDRARRVAAIFQLGEALAGAGAGAPGAAAAVARLEALAADREAGSWIRKRAKRAVGKIRGVEPGRS